MNRTLKIIKAGARKSGAVKPKDDKIQVSREQLLQLQRNVKGALSQSDTPAKGGGLVNVTTSKVVGLNYVDL
jgi:hypothetical protein